MKTTLIIAFSILVFTGLKAQEVTFTSSEMILKTASGDISGTLTVTTTVGTSPLVLFIAGSGPTDRDCNSVMGINTNAYKLLAEELAAKGISSLRFDKRGIAKSQSAMVSESELRFETYIDDVKSWISQLKQDKRFSKIFILGHSEGSLIGMVAAGQSVVDGFISIAGVGRTADKVIKEQLTGKLPPEMEAESDKILSSLINGQTVAEVNPNLNMLYRPSVQPYMISWFKYDPAIELPKLQIPVLIIQGTTDIQVSVNDAQILAKAKPEAKFLLFPNMNHIMKESGADVQENMGTYMNPKLPLKEGLVDSISNFIKP